MAERLTVIAKTDLNDPRKVRSGALEMEGLLLGKTDPVTLEPKVIERLQRLYAQFETDLEYEFAKKIINGKATLKQYPLYARFRRLIQAEIDLASIKEEDKVLFIGSGPLPISPILIAQMTAATVDCFDHSKQATDQSRKLVEAINLNDKIRIIQAGGDTDKIYGYSVIMVALLAQPKYAILHKAQWSVPDGTRIICRTADENRNPFYEPTNPADAYDSFRSRCHLTGKHTAGPNDTISSLFLTIKGPRENR